MEPTDSRIKIATLTILGATLLVGAVFLTTPMTELYDGFDADGRAYGGMAGEPRFAGDFALLVPWCFRVLTPWLASRLPWKDTLDNFRALAFVSNVLSLLLLMLILRRLGFSRGMTAMGVLLYGGVFWTLKFSFYSPAYIDYQTQLFLLLIVYLTLCGSFYLLLPVLFLAGLQKESLGIYSLFTMARMTSRDPKPGRVALAIRCALLGVVACVSPMLPRHFIVPRPGPTGLEYFMGELADSFTVKFIPVMVQATFSGLGILPVILAAHYGPWVSFLRKNQEWIVYGLISVLCLFGGYDKSRLFLYLLPLAVILALHTIEALKRFQSRRRFLIWTAVVLGVHLYMGRYIAPIGPPGEYIARMVPENAGDGYWRYLHGYLALDAGVLVFTIQYMIGGWRFRPAVGFTRKG